MNLIKRIGDSICGCIDSITEVFDDMSSGITALVEAKIASVAKEVFDMENQKDEYRKEAHNLKNELTKSNVENESLVQEINSLKNKKMPESEDKVDTDECEHVPAGKRKRPHVKK